MFNSYGVDAKVCEGENGRYALWQLGTVKFSDGSEVKVTSITSESKEEEGNFGSLAAAIYRLQNGRPLRGTVNAIARRAVQNYTPDGLELTVNATVKGLAGERQITRSVKVADSSRRNRTGAAYALAGEIFNSVATSGYVYLNSQGWRAAGSESSESVSDESSELV